MAHKPKSKGLTDYEKHLLWMVILGTTGLITVFYYLQLGLGLLFFAVVIGIGLRETNKPSNPNRGSDPKPDPLPVKPKPFNPPPFESVREVEKGEYVETAKARQVERLSMKQLLELNHDDKPKVAKPRAANSSNVDLPLYAPYQILALLNGDTATAMRLYKGIAERYQGKSEQWVWGKVESDLTRDRH